VLKSRTINQETNNLSESNLRRTIAVVTQQPHMFNATLKENLLIARPGASDDELYVALDSAQLLDVVKCLPEGLNTWIGEAGRRLSGGEARRVAVARAILRDAPVWVMDEPTESLDGITERSLMKALQELTAKRTFFMITHRLIDLHWMNHIVMLERGRVIAQGSHERLLRTNSQYAALHARIG